MLHKCLVVVLCFACGGCSSSASPNLLECPPPPPAGSAEETSGDCDCEEGAPAESSVVPTPPQDAGPFAEYANRQNVAFLNERLQELKPSWRDAPISLGINAVGEVAKAIRSVNIDYLNDEGRPTGEGATKAVVVIIADVLDDSLMQERFRFELVRDGADGFRYSKIETSWKCRPGRGAQDFTTSRCI